MKELIIGPIAKNKHSMLFKDHSELCFCILIIFMVSYMLIIFGAWNVDIGASGMNMDAFMIGSGVNASVSCTNGWFGTSAIQQYHIGLYEILGGMLMNMMVFCFVFIYVIAKPKEESKDVKV